MSDTLEPLLVNPPKKRFNLRKYLIAGILVWLPLVVTLWVVNYIISATDRLTAFLPETWQLQHYIGFNIPGTGIVIALAVLFFTGVFAANVLGQKIIKAWDGLLGRIPVVKSIYSSVKQVSNSLLSDSRQAFKDPIWVNFPHQEAWAIGFVSGEISPALQASLPPLQEGDEYLSVYVPTTPNPTSGFLMIVPRSRTCVADISVDEALKYIISLGMVLPNTHTKATDRPIIVESA